MTKEQAYDEQIAPLMARIIAICNEHQIAHLCSFSLDKETGLFCTTANLRPERCPPDALITCFDIIVQNRGPSIFAITLITPGDVINEAE